jgi:hypothetical protein
MCKTREQWVHLNKDEMSLELIMTHLQDTFEESNNKYSYFEIYYN